MRVTRFAPSTTGLPHLGTLLSAVFTSMHARSVGAQLRLRLEDLDPARCKPEYAEALLESFARFGLKWDATDIQSQNQADYWTALNTLAEQGRVYTCGCSRSRIRALGRQAPDGSFAYDACCKEQHWQPGDSHQDLSLRFHLRDELSSFHDLRFGPQSFNVSRVFGDPILLRRDGAFSYHFSSVIDDQNTGVTDLVRGHDLLFASPVQVALRTHLGFEVPSYIHHPLLMEKRGQKMAKLHGSLPLKRVLEKHSPEEVLGKIGAWFALRTNDQAVSLDTLTHDFHWDRVPKNDLLVELKEHGLDAKVYEA
jgi:glutamyl-Q tRNA(Asp) synthetase